MHNSMGEADEADYRLDFGLDYDRPRGGIIYNVKSALRTISG